MTTYHLYHGETVELPTDRIQLDFDLLTKLVDSDIPNRSVGRIMTAVVRWLQGKTSPNLDEKEWYVATLLYKGASSSLSRYSSKMPQTETEEQVRENMVREARRIRKEKLNYQEQ